ncbi:MAG TPA: hypothetical protein VGE31_03040 [Candidatus Paceibacterota bacterium]
MHRTSTGPPMSAAAIALAATTDAHASSDHVIHSGSNDTLAGDGGSFGIDAGTRA